MPTAIRSRSPATSQGSWSVTSWTTMQPSGRRTSPETHKAARAVLTAHQSVRPRA
ncbi:hypothetical protein [Streptomyces sp. NPDC058307]|uniref:hypothetical protein n=1 Tax=Streptomyces sp. NPDC058307 TaxID=3346439 RepID=UPI0036E1C1C2